jgi:hypothetical protein
VDKPLGYSDDTTSSIGLTNVVAKEDSGAFGERREQRLPELRLGCRRSVWLEGYREIVGFWRDICG